MVITTGRLFSFCKNKRSRRDLSLHPEQVLVRKEVGHNENKEFLSFSTRAGKSAAEDEAVHVAGWSLLDWDFSSWIEAKGKEERDREREAEQEASLCSWGNFTEGHRLDYWILQALLCSGSHPGTASDPDAVVAIEEHQR